MRAVTLTSSRWLRTVALGVIVIGSGVLAVQLHRNGHTQGDDFALYLRQARSIFDGDIGAVIADNRFAVLNSDPSFSPLMYPWVWPLLLSPFVNLWGLDYDRLKLVEVAVFMAWLALLHGIVGRRIGRLPALAIVAVIAGLIALAVWALRRAPTPDWSFRVDVDKPVPETTTALPQEPVGMWPPFLEKVLLVGLIGAIFVSALNVDTTWCHFPSL